MVIGATLALLFPDGAEDVKKDLEKDCCIKEKLMTKKEKEIFNWILERSWEKRANPMVIASALALLFPDGAEDVMKELEKDCCCVKEKTNE